MSTKDNLIKALKEANAPQAMIDKAASGYYDDFQSPIATPITQLIMDAREAGLDAIALRAIDGEFDAPAVADTTVYQYRGADEPRKVRIRPVGAIQIPEFQAFLLGEISQEFVIVQPLQITIEKDEDESYIVSDDVFLVYGDGNTRAEAVKDYVMSLIEFFELVKRNVAANPFDQVLFKELESYIQRRGQDAIQADRS